MDSSTPDWREEWVVDPDPLALAQARHRSGYGLNLKAIGAIKVEYGDRPFVAALYTDDSRALLDRLYVELGFSGSRRWTEEKQEQARTLWRELGRDLDPNGPLPSNPPCKVVCWRDEWTAATAEGREHPDLVHTSGYAARFVHCISSASEPAGWTNLIPHEVVEQVSAIKLALGSAQVQRLEQEAEILWMELGFFDSSPTQLAKPFGDDWRALWHVCEHNNEQWVVHVSGLAVMPVFGVVEDDGFKAWTLHVQPGYAYALDWRMQRRVGQKAWDRIHQQGWQLCRELGYVTPQLPTVH